MDTTDPEWKKGSAELLVLSLLEDQPRHGYDVSKLIQLRSGGALRFHVTSLYPLLHRLEKLGWIEGLWVEKAEQRRRRYYSLTPEGRKSPSLETEELAGLRRPHQPHHGDRTCLTGGISSGSVSSPLNLAAAAESDLVEEVAQHLEDLFGELRSGGASAAAGLPANHGRARRSVPAACGIGKESTHAEI